MTDDAAAPDSLLPYARWTSEAMRAVVIEALEHTARNGLPGEHHFYITFRTTDPGVSIPGHLKARFPHEMTIVLQHRFWDLKVDPAMGRFSVGLSFGGVASILTVPISAITAFVDPHVRFGLHFEADALPPEAGDPQPEPDPPLPDSTPQVVSLDAFRRKPARD